MHFHVVTFQHFDIDIYTCLLVLFIDGVLSASEIQSLKIIKSYITGKLFLMIRFLQLQ